MDACICIHSQNQSSSSSSQVSEVAKTGYLVPKHPKLSTHDTGPEATWDSSESRWSKVSPASAQAYHPEGAARTLSRRGTPGKPSTSSRLKGSYEPRRTQELVCKTEGILQKPEGLPPSPAQYSPEYCPLYVWRNPPRQGKDPPRRGRESRSSTPSKRTVTKTIRRQAVSQVAHNQQ